MEDVPICPEWWPRMLWRLHFPPPRPGPGPGPINYPPAIDSIMSALMIHTSSYMLLDKAAAQQIRNTAEQAISHTALRLSRLHEESISSEAELSLEHSDR
jgi:hypothetical protein